MIITAPMSESGHVKLLILGAGWTSTFLIPLLEREGIKYAATTTDGRDGTIAFRFDPASDDLSQFRALPSAQTILITFPLKGAGPSSQLVSRYAAAHPGGPPNYIQLGVTSIWTGPGWQDAEAPYDRANARAVAEDELMACAPATALCLAGLYGGARQPRDWVDRVVRSKADLQAKGALHVVHGDDVARAVVALHRAFTPGRRWLLCDLHVYDWWDLVQDWATGPVPAGAGAETADGGEPGAGAAAAAAAARQRELLLQWLGESMAEMEVRALPRDTNSLGRRLDGRGFWSHMKMWPSHGRIR
ncbi:hypothetical protein F4780DRAFT_276476 [Xylariomycetidae sp. FL0641]|nr:hypothetical protein F4780DRAFT_276476 [Xylariomycetidae sp. FL0641]